MDTLLKLCAQKADARQWVSAPECLKMTLETGVMSFEKRTVFSGIFRDFFAGFDAFHFIHYAHPGGFFLWLTPTKGRHYHARRLIKSIYYLYKNNLSNIRGPK